MEFIAHSPENKFSTPEQELTFLREQVAKREAELAFQKKETPREDLIRSEVFKYENTAKDRVLHEKYQTPSSEAEAITLNLSPEAHDAKVAGFIHLLTEKGVKNTIDMVGSMNDIHLYDDFHRFLVEYIKEGFPVSGLKEKGPLWRELHMTLYEVVVPESAEDKKELKELLSSMEQFYAGMLSVDSDKDNSYFTIEISVANHSNEFIFYCGVPDEKVSLFEKQILSIFPKAKIEPKRDDYNIYNEAGATVGSYAELKKHPALPIRSYDSYDYDPLNILLNSFSKIDKDGEGAAIQIIVRPAGQKYIEEYKKGLVKLEKGEKFKEIFSDSLLHEFGTVVSGMFSTKNDDKPKHVDAISVEAVKAKIQSTIVETNIRITASAENENKAKQILGDLESAFNQFSNTVGNSYSFVRAEKRALSSLLQEFTYRAFNERNKLALNLKELTTTLHFPATAALATSQVKLTKASSAPAPLDLPQAGTMLGINKYRGIETKAYLTAEDRLRHFYTIGQTGTGKTTILKNMIMQDILAGHGVCMIDPHGSDIQDILAIIPKERYEDVIYFDPAYTERPMALNMLEYDRRFPEQKTFVVNELLSIFNKLFDMKVAGGPMFEQYFRNAVLLTIEDPDTGNTLLDVSRVLANKTFREMKIANCKNPIVVQFWNEVASKAGG
ncbi:MAG: hypothetical protein WCW14_04695, partial [Candidatus Paceibacterota bacterium]